MGDRFRIPALPMAPVEHDGCTDPKCQSIHCRRWRRRKLIRPMEVVTAIIARRDGTILMSRRRPNKQCPNCWEWPGGKLEPGESPTAALARECFEELGVDVCVRGHIYTATLNLDVKLTVSLYSVAILDGAVPRNLESEELRWVTPLEAVRTLACTPVMFAAYEDVVLWMEANQDDEFLEGWNT